jgi:broad specificity phosphatase PhoE
VSIWTHGAPGGESAAEVGARLDRVLGRVRPLVLSPTSTPGGEGEGPDHPDPLVVIVGHGHALHVLAARWLGLEPAAGARFRLNTADLSILGFEHARAVLGAWNVAAP